MQQASLKISFPLELLLDYGISKEDAAKQMLQLFVINMYKNEYITSGKAADLLGMKKYDFISLLAKYGENYFNYTSLEMEDEFKLIDQWKSIGHSWDINNG